ncbi:uncharacterized protein FN964_007622 [Alca torda]
MLYLHQPRQRGLIKAAISTTLIVPGVRPVHFQVFLGAGLALLCLSILLGCAICWRHRRCLGPSPQLEVGNSGAGTLSARWDGASAHPAALLLASQRVALQHGSLHLAHWEPCRFGQYSLEELRSFTLRFTIYVRFHSLKDSFVGEVLFPCAQATWDPQVPSSYSWELSSTKTKLRKVRKAVVSDRGVVLMFWLRSAWSQSPKTSCAHNLSRSVLSSPTKSLGQLFLLLQYQALASRIKVLVRKAEDLGRLSRMPGTPGHYIIIHVYHNGHVFDTKETKSITGYNPVWNMPFLFNLPAGDIQQQELSLEFTVMQAHIYTRSSPLGCVQVGPRAPGAGLLHWKEMCSRGQLESAWWHWIQPNALGP